MQYSALPEMIKTTLQKSKVEKLAEIAACKTFLVEELIDLTFHEDKQMGFRAAWILENIYTLHQERFLPSAGYFLTKFPLQNNMSARRHYSKILALMTKKNASLEIKNIIIDSNTGILAEIAFSWLIDKQVPVAIKSHCLNILANLSIQHSWIKDELTQTMDFLIDKESIGFYAKVKQIRKELTR